MTSNSETYDVAIIGGGLLGLATAYELLLAEPHLKVVVLEKEAELVFHQSGHNSGVIHSGVYYEPGSNKAKLCMEGYHKMIDFCNRNNIEYNLCGKLIVATNNTEVERLNDIYANGMANKLKGLELINEKEITTKERNIRGKKALFVPQTGVVDYRKVGRRLGEIISSKNGSILCEFKVQNIQASANGFQISSKGKTVNSKFLINCAGLYSDRIAQLSGAIIQHKIIPFRGEYYRVNTTGDTAIQTLIYPVPDPKYPFLGVHFTKSIYGEVEAGPNAVLAHSREGYSHSNIKFKDLADTLFYRGFLKFAARNITYGIGEYRNSKSKKRYIKKAQLMMPSLSAKDLTKSRSGVRAQACDKQGNLIQDFLFIHQKNALHVCNAPSPAATSSLAIAERIIKETNLI